MAYTGRTREEIRASILAHWSAEYAARGLQLVTARGSDAYLLGGGFAVELEGLEAQAEQTTRDILPDQASEEVLERHGYVFNVPRLSGDRASHTVTVTSSVAGTYLIPVGTQMAFTDGTLYDVDSPSVVTSGGSPSGTISVTAVDPGTAGTRAVGETLTFVSAPTGMDSTGTVLATVTEGSDEESAAEWALRIVERLRDRPASGNRADWRDWIRAFTATEIEDAYVYPLLAPPASYPGAGAPDTPGTLTVIPIGPAQGDRVVNTRIVPYDNASGRTAGVHLDVLHEYIEGNVGTDGASANVYQRRPASLPEGNYSIEALTESTPEDVVVDLVVTDDNAPAWAGTLTVVSATSTTLVVSGDQSAMSGRTALVNIGTSNVRGGYKLFTLGTGVYSGGSGNTTFAITAQADIATAVASSLVYPAPGNWSALRTAAFAYFDALGPGDTSPASRWPQEDVQARATVYRTALAAALMVPGVLSASTTSPASDVTPAAKAVVVLGTFAVTC